MSFSTRVRYTAAGTGREFDIPFPYLEAAHVKVLVRGLPAAFAWVTPSRIALATTPASGEAIDIRRETPVASQLVDFQDGATLTAEELNTSAKQLLFCQQELLDGYQKSIEEAEAHLGENLGVTVPSEDVVDTVVQLILNDAALANVAGIIADINANATSILQQTLRVDGINNALITANASIATVRGMVDAILAGGAGLNEDALAVIYTETVNRVNGDNALLSILNLIGAKNTAGTAFILNVDTVRISLTETLAQRLAAISAEFGALSAAILFESTTRADALSAMASTVNTVSAVANARNRTFAQTTAPTTGMVAGDLWFDTDDGNKAYRYNGTAWVLTDDARIAANAAAIVTTNTAWANADAAMATSITNVAATAMSRNRTFYQTTAPTGAVAGDLWFDTDDGNKPYRYDGTAWVEITDNRILLNSAAVSSEATARADGDSALASQITTVSATALARNRTFSQPTAPTGASSGDLWYDTDDGNKLYRYNGTAWVATDDTRIAANAAAITVANTARADGDSALASQITSVSAVANARNRTFFQTTAPTGAVAGDLWFDSDDGNKAYRYSGSAWVLTDDTRIGSNAAAITTEATARATADAALANTLSLIGAVGDAGASFILDTNKVKVSASETFATRLASITTTANNNAAGIITEQNARIAADSAMAAQIAAISAAVGSAGARTYAQASAPTGVAGDIWYDTDDSNKVYRYSGSAWVALDDARIAGTIANLTTESTARASGDAALASQITTVSATANARNRTFAQSPAPSSGMVAGDLWFDTGDANKSYRYSGSAWVLTDDTRIATNTAAIAAEVTARANADTALTTSINTLTASVATANARIGTEETTRASETSSLASQVTSVSAVANGRNRTFAQPAAPTGANTGDLWVDTDDSNKLYRYGGSSWVAVDDSRISVNAAAISAEQTARADADSTLASQITTLTATANSRNRTFYSISEPLSGMTTGDLWFDSDDGNKAYRYNGTSWVLTADTRIAANAAAIATANTARADGDSALASQITTLTASLGGKNKTFAQINEPPSGMIAGDIWFDSDDGNKSYRYSGSAWLPVDDARIASVTTMASAVADIDGRLTATYGFQLDVNGRVSGMKAQASGAGGAVVSTIDFTTDKFRVFNGTSANPVFEVSGGNVYIAANTVNTGSLEAGAAVRHTHDQSFTATTIPSRGAPSGRVLIKTLDFQVDKADSKFVVLISMQYNSSNSNQSYTWVKIGQTAPTWATSGSATMTNADKSFIVSAYLGPCTLVYTFTGLPVGTNTLEVWAGSTGSGSHSNQYVDPFFSITEYKKAL